ncbi:MAG: hypothetical protein IJ583_11905 [Firmicutes bacterium]|nr:hypothetical protein [Bacillota bacterium]
MSKSYMCCYKTGIFSIVCFLITSLVCINNMVELSTFVSFTFPFVIIMIISVIALCITEAKERKITDIDEIISGSIRVERNFYISKGTAVNSKRKNKFILGVEKIG